MGSSYLGGLKTDDNYDFFQKVLFVFIFFYWVCTHVLCTKQMTCRETCLPATHGCKEFDTTLSMLSWLFDKALVIQVVFDKNNNDEKCDSNFKNWATFHKYWLLNHHLPIDQYDSNNEHLFSRKHGKFQTD